MPNQEQIRGREELEFHARMCDHWNNLLNGVPLCDEHEALLQAWTGNASVSGATSSYSNGDEFSDSETCEKLFTSVDKDTEVCSASATTGMAMFAQKYHYINVHSPANGEWYGAIATLDTGSDENWISQEVVDRLSLNVHRSLVTKFKSFAGETVASDATVHATWSSCGQGTSHANVFRVIPNAPFDILLGRSLITSGELHLSATDPELQAVLSNSTGGNPNRIKQTRNETPEEKAQRKKRDTERGIKAEQQHVTNSKDYGPVKDDPKSRGSGDSKASRGSGGSSGCTIF